MAGEQKGAQGQGWNWGCHFEMINMDLAEKFSVKEQ